MGALTPCGQSSRIRERKGCVKQSAQVRKQPAPKVHRVPSPAGAFPTYVQTLPCGSVQVARVGVGEALTITVETSGVAFSQNSPVAATTASSPSPTFHGRVIVSGVCALL